MRNLIISLSGLLCATCSLGMIHPYHTTWVEWLVLVAVWAVVPAGLKLYAGVRLFPLHWLAAVFLSIAFVWPGYWISTILALPWLAWSLYSFFRSVSRKTTLDLFFSVALLFWGVAAAWAVAHISNWRPLAFSPTIVLLTAAHFHYAGFTLMLLFALTYRAYPSSFVKYLGYLAVVATGTVALAITATKLTGWETGEAISGTLMATAGTLLAIFHGWKANEQAPVTALCWRVGGVLLLTGMVLAAAYALRVFLPFRITIPEMQAWHGSLNASALGLLLLGWIRKLANRRKDF